MCASVWELGGKRDVSTNVRGSACFRRKGNRNQQEYLKRKKQKKVQRFKEMEEVREQEKSKWQQFNTKVSLGLLLFRELNSCNIGNVMVSLRLCFL